MASPQAAKKRICGKRVRARQRERAGHDLRRRYRQSDLPANAHLGILTIEDPYGQAGAIDRAGNLHIEATLEPVRHRDGTLSEGKPAWTPPPRPLLNVVANLRQDPFARLYARRKISEAQYRAGRIFQQLAETATLGRMSNPDLLRARRRYASCRWRTTAGSNLADKGEGGAAAGTAALPRPRRVQGSGAEAQHGQHPIIGVDPVGGTAQAFLRARKRSHNILFNAMNGSLGNGRSLCKFELAPAQDCSGSSDFGGELHQIGHSLFH
jgi:hypothetical protein